MTSGFAQIQTRAFHPVTSSAGSMQKVRTKAAKSSDAAELIHYHTSSLISSISSSGELSSFSSLGFAVEEYSALSAEIQNAFKKATKKDASTRIKALEDLDALFSSSPEYMVIAALEPWKRLYKKLSTDSEKRVREKLHSGPFSTLVRIVKRELAPYLKQLIGPWLCSQRDPVEEVAKAAQNVFAIAIPPHKHVDTLTFCKTEILAFIEDRLNLPIQSLAEENKALTKVQINELYERTFCSAIDALAFFIASVSKETNSKLMDQYRTIFSDKFWTVDPNFVNIKYRKYSLFVPLSTCLHSFLEENIKTVNKLLLAMLSEKDPNSFASIWESVLSLFKNFPQIFESIKFSSTILPKLCFLMKNSFFTSGPVSYPSLLPLLSLLPANVIGEGKFFQIFFDSFWKGLYNEHCIQHSHFFDSFFEIILYYIKQANSVLSGIEGNQQLSSDVAATTKQHLLELLFVPIVEMLKMTSSKFSAWEIIERFSKTAVQGAKQTYPSSINDIQYICHRLSAEIDMLVFSAQQGNNQLPIAKAIERSSDLLSTLVTHFQSEAAFFHHRLPQPLQMLLAHTFNRSLELTQVQGSQQPEFLNMSVVIAKSAHPLLSFLSEAEIQKVFEQTVLPRLTAASGVELAQLSWLASSIFLSSPQTKMVQSVVCFSPIDMFVRQARSIETEFLPSQYLQLFSTTIDLLQQSSSSSLSAPQSPELSLLATSICQRYVLSVPPETFHIPSPNSESDCAFHLLMLLFDGQPQLTAGPSALLENCPTFLKNLANFLEADPSSSPASRSTRAMQLQLLVYQVKLLTACLLVILQDPVINCSALTSGDWISKSLETIFLLRSCTHFSWEYWTLQHADIVVKDENHLDEGDSKDFLEKEVDYEEKDGEEEEDQINFSPIALAARLCWQKIESAIISKGSISQPAREQFVLHISNILKEQTETMDVAWFNPTYLSEQLATLIALHPHSEQPLLSLFLLDPNHWKLLRRQLCLSQNVSLFRDTFIDYLSQDFDHSSSSSASPGVALYPRWSRVLLSLLFRFGMPMILDQRNWLFLELLSLSLLTRDYLTCPIGQGPLHDEWNLLHEYIASNFRGDLFARLGSYLDISHIDMAEEDKGKLDAAKSSLLVKAIEELIQRCTIQDPTSEEPSSLDSLSLSWISSRLVNGQQQNAELFARRFLADHLIHLGKAKVDRVFQATLPSILPSLHPKAFQSLHLDDISRSVFSKDKSQCGLSIFLENSRALSFLILAENMHCHDQAFLFLVEVIEMLDFIKTADPQSPIHASLLRLLIGFCRHQYTVDLIDKDTWLAMGTYCQTFLPTSNIQLQYLALKLFRLLDRHMRDLQDADINDSCKKARQLILSIFFSLESLTLNPEVGYSPTQMAFFTEISRSVENFLFEAIASSNSQPLSILSKLLGFPLPAVQTAAAKLLWTYFSGLPPAKELEMPSRLGNSQEVFEDQIPLEALPQEAQQLIQFIADTRDRILPVNKEENRKRFKKIRKKSYHDLVQVFKNDDPHSSYFFRKPLSGYFCYLLSWASLLQWYRHQNQKVKYRVGVFLRQQKFVLSFCTKIFSHLELLDSDILPSGQGIPFEYVDPLDDHSFLGFIGELALLTIRTLPALVRNWWIQSDRDISAFVEKHISKFMKPAILRSELEQILDYKSDSEKFHIIAFANSSDVVAVFKEDEASIRLSLSIPPNYPLKSVEVSFERKMGMSENNWRKWIFSMNSLLMTQDASILEAILSWKSSMMKKFEGMEPCYICYGIFHVSNSSTPNLTCKTCKNKFHAACLYKWFNTSYKSNCPLCQTPWMG